MLDLIGKLFEVEQRAHDGDLDDDALLVPRQTESKPILNAIHAWALENARCRAVHSAKRSRTWAVCGTGSRYFSKTLVYPSTTTRLNARCAASSSAYAALAGDRIPLPGERDHSLA